MVSRRYGNLITAITVTNESMVPKHKWRGELLSRPKS